LKVTNEKTENSQVFLTIEMEPAEVEKSLESSYHRLARKTNIPGFRKGKAPREMLERYIGKGGLLEEALNSLIPQAIEETLKKRKIEAIAEPLIEVTQTDPVVFKATVPLRPSVELGDYHRIKVKPEAVKLSEEDVSSVIEQLRHQHAAWEPVERPVEFGDLVVLDVESNMEGEPFINQKAVQYQVIRDLSLPAPGFAEQLPGMKKDEEKEFELQFPLDDSRGGLAGKEASFKVKVAEIKQEMLPELDDDFAQSINPDFTTLDSLRERVSSDLKLRAEENARIDFEDKVIGALVGLTEVKFPPILVELEVDQLLRQRFQRLQGDAQGLEEYLRGRDKTEEELREEIRPLATTRVTRSLALGKLAEEEKIEVSDSEIDAEVRNMIKSTTETEAELQKSLNTLQFRESVRRLLVTRKTVQRLVEIAGDSKTNIKTKQRGRKK
jgi:trigger factor